MSTEIGPSLQTAKDWIGENLDVGREAIALLDSAEWLREKHANYYAELKRTQVLGENILVLLDGFWNQVEELARLAPRSASPEKP